MLRENILGKERFDGAFRYYTQQWAFKHPTPYDFFHAIENHSGETLDYFWRGWFLNQWKMDFGVTEVAYANNNPSSGAVITLKCYEKLPVPLVIEVKEENGKTSRINLPVEVWYRGDTWKIAYRSSSRIQQVAIDPDKTIMDVDLSDNSWQGAK